MKGSRAVCALLGIATRERRPGGGCSPGQAYFGSMGLGNGDVVAGAVESKAGCRIEGTEKGIDGRD